MPRPLARLLRPHLYDLPTLHLGGLLVVLVLSLVGALSGLSTALVLALLLVPSLAAASMCAALSSEDARLAAAFRRQLEGPWPDLS